MPTALPTTEDTLIYECAVLYPYPFNQKEEATLLKEVEGFFAEAGAKLVAKDAWGRRGLAYPIKGFNEANFVIYYYEMEPAKVKEVDGSLRIAKGVLRHLFIKPPKNYQITPFAERYQQWLKERVSVEDVRAQEREEKLQEQVARKAKQQAQRTTERKKEPAAAPTLEEGAITQQIDKLISDDIDL